MQKFIKKITQKIQDPKWRKGMVWNLVGITAVIIFLYLVDSLLGLLDIFKERTVPTGLLLGAFIILWGFYFLFTYIKSRIGNLTKAGAILWMKSVAEVAEFVNKFGAIIGYPAIEIARTNNKLTVGAVEVLRVALQNLSDFARRLAIFGSIILIAVMIPIYFPVSNLGMVIIVALIVISFTVMGITEPIVKPLEGKNLRRIIRPISLALPVIGIIFLFNAHGRPFVDEYANIFFGYIVVLIIMSFKSYHGMYTSNAARHWLWYTVIILLISLGLQRINFWDSEYWLWAKNLGKNATEKVSNDNANSKLNIHLVTDTTAIFITVKTLTVAGDNQGNTIILIPNDEVSKLDSPLVYNGPEGFATVMIKNEFNLFAQGPVYVPNRFLTKKESTSSKVTDKTENNQSIENTLDTEDDNTFTLPPGENVKVMNLPQGKENIIFRSTGRYQIIERDGPVTVLSRTFIYNTQVAGGMLEVQNIEDFPIQFKVEL